MDTREMEFQVIMKELDHADTQIQSYMDLQMKILGVVFTFLGGILGLLLSTKVTDGTRHQDLAKLLIIASSLGSFGVLQSSIVYGTVIGYIYGKVHLIAPRLARLLDLKEAPLLAVRAFRESPAMLPVMLATGALALGISALNLGVIWSALRLATSGSLTQYLGLGALALFAVVIVVQVQMALAMRAVGVASNPEKEVAKR